MNEDKSIWPNVKSSSGRAFAFRLSTAASFLSALTAVIVALLVWSGHGERLGYPGTVDKLSTVSMSLAFAGCAVICAIGVRLERLWAAWGVLAVIVAGFLADAWFGQGALYWLAAALTILAVQGVRATLTHR